MPTPSASMNPQSFRLYTVQRLRPFLGPTLTLRLSCCTFVTVLIAITRLCSFPAVYLSLPPLFHIFCLDGASWGCFFPACSASCFQLPHFSFFCILTFYGGAFYTFFQLFFLSLHLLFPRSSWGCVGITSTG